MGIVSAEKELEKVALGGTAVGTGANTPRGYRNIAIAELAKKSNLPLRPQQDMQYALQSRYAVANVSSALKNFSVELSKIANDIRLDGVWTYCRIIRIRYSCSTCWIFNHARKGKPIASRMHEHDLLQHDW